MNEKKENRSKYINSINIKKIDIFLEKFKKENEKEKEKEGSCKGSTKSST